LTVYLARLIGLTVILLVAGLFGSSWREGKLDMREGVRWLLVCAFAFGASESWAAEPGDAAHQSGCGSRCSLVRVAVVGTQNYARKVTLTGSVEPTFSSNVAFRISGKIEQRFVEVGDHITADKVLARIDPQTQQAALDSAKAALVSAKALLTQATTNFERQTELIKSGYTTRRTYDQAEQELRTEEAAVESAQAAVSTAEEQLGYAELKAGIAGIVTARNAETGQVVQAGLVLELRPPDIQRFTFSALSALHPTYSRSS